MHACTHSCQGPAPKELPSVEKIHACDSSHVKACLLKELAELEVLLSKRLAAVQNVQVTTHEKKDIHEPMHDKPSLREGSDMHGQNDGGPVHGLNDANKSDLVPVVAAKPPPDMGMQSVSLALRKYICIHMHNRLHKTHTF